MLCLRPESWAEAAGYPTHITLVPLIAGDSAGGGGRDGGAGVSASTRVGEFAAAYDRYYPPMELSSEGVLSVKGELKGRCGCRCSGWNCWWIRRGGRMRRRSRGTVWGRLSMTRMWWG